MKRIGRAGDRALGDPEKFYCTMYADKATAGMAVGMLGMADLSEQTVLALGWAGAPISGHPDAMAKAVITY